MPLKYLLTLALLFSFFLQAQLKTDPELNRQLQENSKLFSTNIDQAYIQLDPLLKMAKALKDNKAELKILERKCRYFYSKAQVDSLIGATEKLQDKAILYKDLYSEAMSNIYLAEAYSINQLYDKALSQLDKAYSTLLKDNSGSEKIFFAKANVLSSYANVYTDKGEPKNAVKKLQQVIKSYEQLNDPQAIRSFQYLNYSNIASLYALYNLDSANYYAKKSIALKPKKDADDKSMIINYYVLGRYLESKNKYAEAQHEFHKALKIGKNTGTELNQKEIYQSLVDIFHKIGKSDSIIFYENKLKQLEIDQLQSKYNSLQKVISKDKTETEENIEKSRNWVIALIGFFIAVFIYLLYNFLKKRKKELYSSSLKTEDTSPEAAYKNLLELAQNNDPAFLFSFENIFPNFSEKLLKINPQLQQSEIEFCALLKLKLSTKDIAKLSFIETRTVQNKKYRIRKRLDIPQSIDIYQWFDAL